MRDTNVRNKSEKDTPAEVVWARGNRARATHSGVMSRAARVSARLKLALQAVVAVSVLIVASGALLLVIMAGLFVLAYHIARGIVRTCLSTFGGRRRYGE